MGSTSAYRGLLDTILYDKVCQVGGFLLYSVFSTNKTCPHDITELLLKVALNSIILILILQIFIICFVSSNGHCELMLIYLLYNIYNIGVLTVNIEFMWRAML